MSKCQYCKVEILDNTERCPLCQCVLEVTEQSHEPMYPNARVAVRKFRFLENLVLFISIVAAVVLVAINVMTDLHFLWSLIAVMALFYANVVLRLAIIGRSGYLFKSVCLVFMTIFMLVGIDYLTGDRGWALNYVLPAGILFLDVGILVLMIVNHRNWQSYMLLQIFVIILSLIPLLLFWAGIVKTPNMAVVAIAASVFLFLGTLIIGDQRARTELKRRFHI